jgi:hypothetical protein
LFDGSNWVTPLQPLFNGVQRKFLLDQDMVIARQIQEKDLDQYTSYQLVNAMNPMTLNRFVSIEGIQ